MRILNFSFFGLCAALSFGCSSSGGSSSASSTCTGGMTECGTSCTNLTTDSANCGACGTACTTGEACTSGKCVATTPTCPTAKPDACGTGASAFCTDLSSDPSNCGMCGTTCPTGVCADKMCGCPGSQTVCTSTCVDTQTNPANCGACGTTCSASEACVAGACACTGTLTVCSGACVDTATSTANCGKCGNACPTGELCAAGACADSCPAGTPVQCGTGTTAYCANTTSDPNNCGACGTVCPTGQSCTSSACACPTATPDPCGTGATAICTSTATDNANCGACGTVCPGGQSCTGGNCGCPTAEPDPCGTGATAICTNTATDNANCGTCGAACGSTQTCTGGACTCPAASEPNACGTGATAICTNTTTDNNNCGSCGTVCGTGSICMSSACVSLCPSGETACPSNGGTSFYCANLTSDPTNCGACATLCATQTECSASTCTGGPLSSFWFEDTPATTTTYTDHGSAGNTLTETGAPTQVTGYSGQGLKFNNAGGTTLQYLSLAVPKNLPLAATARTLEAWVAPGVLTGTNNDGTYNGILAYGLEVTDQGQLLSMSSAYRVTSANWSNDLIEAATGPAGTANNWSHVAYTFDGTTRTLYLNGAVVDTDKPTGIATAQGELRIGTTDEPGRLFTGVIDEARIYGYARSGAQLLDDATLVARYWFDSGDGTDIGPNHITATVNGATSVPGHIGKGMAFNAGATTNITIPSLALLGLTGWPFSVEMWVNMPNAAGADLFDVHASSGWCTAFLGTNATGHPAAQIYGGTPSASRGVTSPTAITPNTWVHLAQTWSATNGLRLYVNGVLVASDTTINTYTASGLADTALLGNTSNAGCATSTVPNTPYDGFMDNVQIYTRERTAAEIQADAAQ